MATSAHPGAGKPAGRKKLTKEQLAAEIAHAVGAGKAAAVETVDFADPDRPKVCLEVDFPILPINQIAVIEGNAGKPIYQMSKWWARRRSSVFRSLLLSAAMKAPDDPAEAAKAVWDVYYNNHQRRGAFKHLKVVDIFMGGGTTLIEGSRLGMRMSGVDLNPVAWFVVKNATAKVDRADVEALLASVESEVRPQVMPFYACGCPRGHKGTWTRVATGEVMGPDFDPLTLPPATRADYRYQGPEIIYVFWVKHGPCHVTGCGHRTPLMSGPVLAVKTLTVKAWPDHQCGACEARFDIEDADARMAPGVPLVIADSEVPFAVCDGAGGVTCPSCGHHDRSPGLTEKTYHQKKVELSLLVHPEWMAGEAGAAPDGTPYGGSALSDAEASARWYAARARRLRIVEVRGTLPPVVVCPESRQAFSTNSGTLPGRSTFACGSCGAEQDVLEAVSASGDTGPVAPALLQCYCPECKDAGDAYGGRFFSTPETSCRFAAADREWHDRREADLALWWPRVELSRGWKTHGWGIPEHGYTHYWKMFNARQLLAHAQLMRAVMTTGAERFGADVREFVLGAFQQYLRNQCMFAFWNIQADKLEPHFSNINFHPKAIAIENSVFGALGRGNWRACAAGLGETLAWSDAPWEVASTQYLRDRVRDRVAASAYDALPKGKSAKVECGDPVLPGVHLCCGTATDLSDIADGDVDLVITDPPFGGLLQYAELADFFYVWLCVALRERYPAYFGMEYTPKSLEVVANPFRQTDDADALYQRLLTECWREVHRVLKPGGVLAFTFHHSEDEPWVSVLKSLFDAGFYLEATYPIRSDETKGDHAQFGAQKIEYDIIHVCRKRHGEPTAVSWARMRRCVLDDVRQLRTVLENHATTGLSAADLKVIKRGKALEYYSRHYGKVFVDEEHPFDVRDALAGINQLLDEEVDAVQEPPPGHAEPFTRQFLSLFRGVTEQPRDQVQKGLRGTGYSPVELTERGWCTEERKVFYVKEPRALAAEWCKRHRRALRSDYDQVAFLIGACADGSGINVRETLNNDNFRPHPALKAVLDWYTRHGATLETRAAARRAVAIYAAWEQDHPEAAGQLSFFAE